MVRHPLQPWVRHWSWRRPRFRVLLLLVGFLVFGWLPRQPCLPGFRVVRLELAGDKARVDSLVSAWSVSCRAVPGPTGTSNDVVEAQISKSVHWDTAWIPFYSTLLALAGVAVAESLRASRDGTEGMKERAAAEPRRPIRLLPGALLAVAWLPWVAGLADVVENVGLLYGLRRGDTTLEYLIARGAALLKFGLLGVAVAGVLFGIVVRLVRGGRSPAGHASASRGMPGADDDAARLHEVIEEETKYLLRHRHPVPARRDEAEHRAEMTRGLVGLALSGGGIRSATTCLGVLQALSRMGVLPLVDYLSTVSGGGYIGGALSAYLSLGKVPDAPDTLRSTDEFFSALSFAANDRPQFSTTWEKLPFRDESLDRPHHDDPEGRRAADLIAHLRTHGNFLIARRGLFQRDTLRSIGNVLTGISYNLSLFAVTMFAVVALYLSVVLAVAPSASETLGWFPTTPSTRPELVDVDSTIVRTRLAPCPPGAAPDCATETRTVRTIRIVPSLGARIAENARTVYRAVTISRTDSARAGDSRRWVRRTTTKLDMSALRPVFSGAIAGFVAVLLVFGVLAVALRHYWKDTNRPASDLRPGDSEEDWRERRVLRRVAATLTVVGFGSLALLRWHPWWAVASEASGPPELVWLFVPFAAMVGARLATFILAVVDVASLVSVLSLFTLKWRWLRTRRARSIWGAVQATTIYGLWFTLAFAVLPFAIYAIPGSQLGVGVGAIASALASRFLATRQTKGGRFALPPGLLKHVLGLVVALALGLAVLFTGAVLVSRMPHGHDAWFAAATCAAVLLAIVGVLGFAVNHNSLSPHYFYRDRLAETYLRAEIPDEENRMRVFHDLMEMPLYKLHGVDAPAAPAAPAGTWRNPAPYHLVSTAINLAGSRDLTRKDRKSGYWLFSKLYCGSTHTGFRPTALYRCGETKLSQAVAISGAAAGSGIGFHTFFAQAFATVLFNVRLGQWLENPRRSASMRSSERWTFWPYFLWKEVRTDTTEKDWLVNLSDGGHTGDNLGIYPLLQRRCKVVIAVDAERDPSLVFGSFTEALRHAYVDMGIRVDIELNMLRADPQTGLSRSHCAIGRIRYPDRPDQESYLIYLKNSLTGDESAPIVNYRTSSPGFPHESTADLFFDDAQFESYRALGVHLAEHTFGKWVGTEAFAYAAEFHQSPSQPVEA